MRFFTWSAALVLLCMPALDVSAQPDGLLQLDDALHRFLLRQQTAGLLPDAHLSHLPLSAYEARRYLDSLDSRRERLSPADTATLSLFLGRRQHPVAGRLNRLWPALYADGRNLFSVSGEDYNFEAGPLAYLTYGRARQTERDGREPWIPVWQNTRGARAAGHIGRHVFFEARLEEVQRLDPRPAPDKKSAPRLTYVRGTETPGVYDYQIATGVVGLRTKHFEARFGRDRNRWGPGMGSLMLSNYAAGYDHLQLRTTVWRIQLVNLFAALTDLTFTGGPHPDQVWPKKYLAAHRLEVNLPGRVQVGAFEAISFATDTSFVQRRRGFDAAYLNPVMFLRAAEADRGSPDNALLGVDAAWTALPGLRLYTQLLLDELVVSEIGKKSWRNKWGWMAGLHVALPAPNVTLRLEYARLRPYLYSHRWPVNAYVNYNDVLGHPAGPNAKDLAFFVDFAPGQRFHAALNLAYTQRGRNTDEVNYGSDPRLPYAIAGTEVGLPYGIRQNVLLGEAKATYELLPGLHVGGALFASSVDDELTGLDRYLAPQALVQWGMPFQSTRY